MFTTIETRLKLDVYQENHINNIWKQKSYHIGVPPLTFKFKRGEVIYFNFLLSSCFGVYFILVKILHIQKGIKIKKSLFKKIINRLFDLAFIIIITYFLLRYFGNLLSPIGTTFKLPFSSFIILNFVINCLIFIYLYLKTKIMETFFYISYLIILMISLIQHVRVKEDYPSYNFLYFIFYMNEGLLGLSVFITLGLLINRLFINKNT